MANTNGRPKAPHSPLENNDPSLRSTDANDSIEVIEDSTSDDNPLPYDPTLLPGGSRDLSFIGTQAFVLGNVLTGAILLTIYAIALNSAWWRLPAFFTCLSIFHFLEFWTTARYNVPACRASSFLLFNNGRAYTAAHACATLELVASQYFPAYQKVGVYGITIAAGVLLVLVGQVVRSVAMCQAGTNFNHMVQGKKKDDHELVTDGLYSYFRHPSYFGFFWWALGTQFLVGNKVCLVGYAVVLWRFFDKRIRIEEKFLVSFFGPKYEDFRKRTGTKIPLIP